MDETVAEEYKSSLSDLNFNSKPLINMLTMLADENKKHASVIVKTIVNHIDSASSDAKLPGLYLVDSIIKNIGAEYMKIFCQKIVYLFTSVFEKVDENTRSLMFKLRQTWTGILPNKVLHSLDNAVKRLDPAWPITAKSHQKKILINPKFIGESVEQKKESEVFTGPSSSVKTDDEMNQKQVLQQLLEKQGYLKQLEEQKQQHMLQNENIIIDDKFTTIRIPTKTKKNPRDPRNTSPKKTYSFRIAHDDNFSKTDLPKILSKFTVQDLSDCLNAHIQRTCVSKVNIVEQCAKPSDHQTGPQEKISDYQTGPQEKISDLQTDPQEKISPNIKNEKNALNKNKQIPSYNDNIGELQCNLNESAASTSKDDKAFVKTDTSPVKFPEKNARDNKGSKVIPKKKDVFDNTKMSRPAANVPTNVMEKRDASNNKMSQLTTNVPSDVMRKKISQMRIPKKSEKQKCSLKLDSSNSNKDNKVIAKNENEELAKNSSDNVNITIESKNMKMNDTINKPKSVKKHKSQESDLNAIAKKDEDLRIKPASLIEDTTSNKMLKHDVSESSSLSVETEKLQPPRKKLKRGDTENQYPDRRSETAVLFGNEDQDLRHPSYNDVNSKDWSQYKANHPDEFSPSPVRQDSFDGKSRFRRYPFTYKYYHPSDYDRYGPSRPFRGRYFSRRNFHRRYAPRLHRGMRGRWFHYSPIASVIASDSQAILQQAEEKFHSGQITEAEYIDLRCELQKMAEYQQWQNSNNEYQLFKSYQPQKQEIEHHIAMPDNQIAEQNKQKEKLSMNLLMQKSSTNLPPKKPFILDGKERILHFIDDKAIIFMDNNEPREVKFKDEKKQVIIDGIADPLTLGFDGKSSEFELEGRRHIMRFGIPGREIYINNRPYEAQFGGPPLIVMLDDGHTYKMHLTGPPPQVVIVDKPQHKLFSKHHDVVDIPKVEKTHVEYDVPPCGSLQDVDMRVKPDSVSQDILLNKDSPFYCEDMKDVDYRKGKVPSSNNLKETEKNLPGTFNENIASSFETWINKESVSNIAFQDGNKVKKSSKKDPDSYVWNEPLKQQHTSMQAQQQRVHPSKHLAMQRRQNLQMQCQPESIEQQHPPEHLQRQHLPEHPQRPPPPEHQQRPPPPEHQQRPPPPEHQQRPPPAEDQQKPPPPEHQQKPPPPEHQQRPPPPQHQQKPPPPKHQQSPPPKHQQRSPPPKHQQRSPPPKHQQRSLPPKHQQRPPPPEHQQRSPPSDHIQQKHPREHSPQHMHEHSSFHINQYHEHLLTPIQHQQPFNSEESQKWTYEQEDIYWQKDSHRKNYRSPYLEESNLYHPSQISTSRHFQDEDDYYEPHLHQSFGPYAQRSPFKGRKRRRYPGPRYRPPVNTGFVRPRQNAPLLGLPRTRFPAEPQKPLLPPPPFFASFPSTSAISQSEDVPSGAPNDFLNQKIGLLPTPSHSFENPPTEPSVPKVQVDVGSLLEKLVAAGIINTKIYEESEQEPEISVTDEKADDNKEIEEVSEETEKIELTLESLRIYRPDVITALHKGQQCATCGIRFKEMQSEPYSRHLDWHFRMNRREKDTKKAISRIWYYEIEDWLQFEEFEDYEERTPSYFDLQAEDTKPEIVETPAQISVVATDQERCPVCLEKFQLFWVEDEEEWHYRNSVRYEDVAYHPACYEDFKKTSEAERAHKSLENIASDDIEPEIFDILNIVLDKICSIPEVKNIHKKTVSKKDDKVPSAEAHPENFLEGKPGEEEIIGLIPESDVETGGELSKDESKMVVMQSGGITLKVKAESLQCHSPSNQSENVDDEKHLDDDEEIEFRPPTPDPNFEVQPPKSRGRELSGLCCIM